MKRDLSTPAGMRQGNLRESSMDGGSGLGALAIVMAIGGGAWFYFTTEQDREHHLFIVWALMFAWIFIGPILHWLGVIRL